MRKVAACVLCCLFLTAGATAQTTNLSIFQDMAVECLGAVPVAVDTLELDAPDSMPYVRSALVTHWQNEGRAVFVADSSSGYPRLSYEVEKSDVAFSRRGRRVQRRVSLALSYTLAEPNGLVLVDDRCTDEYVDIIRRQAVPAVQSDAHPETQSEPPQSGWFRRYLEPVVITTATAVAVYLFFALRSADGSDT